MTEKTQCSETAPSEAAAEYAKRNPLGGPARVFEAMASRIRAGEDYDSVLADYSLQTVPAAPAGDTPRVDAHLASINERGITQWDTWVEVDFARTLERENADLIHDIERAVAENTRLLGENLAMEKDAQRWNAVVNMPSDKLLSFYYTRPDERAADVDFMIAADRAAAGREGA